MGRSLLCPRNGKGPVQLEHVVRSSLVWDARFDEVSWVISPQCLPSLSLLSLSPFFLPSSTSMFFALTCLHNSSQRGSRFPHSWTLPWNCLWFMGCHVLKGFELPSCAAVAYWWLFQQENEKPLERTGPCKAELPRPCSLGQPAPSQAALMSANRLGSAELPWLASTSLRKRVVLSQIFLESFVPQHHCGNI